MNSPHGGGVGAPMSLCYTEIENFNVPRLICFSQEFNSTYLRSNLLNLVNNLRLTRKSESTDFSESFVSNELHR